MSIFFTCLVTPILQRDYNAKSESITKDRKAVGKLDVKTAMTELKGYWS